MVRPSYTYHTSYIGKVYHTYVIEVVTKVIKPGLDEEKEIAESQNNASMSSVYVRGNWNIHSFCLESIRIAKKEECPLLEYQCFRDVAYEMISRRSWQRKELPRERAQNQARSFQGMQHY